MDFKASEKLLWEKFSHVVDKRGLINLDRKDIENFLDGAEKLSIKTYNYSEVMSKEFDIPEFDAKRALIFIIGSEYTSLEETFNVSTNISEFAGIDPINIMFSTATVDTMEKPNIREIHVAFSDGEDLSVKEWISSLELAGDKSINPEKNESELSEQMREVFEEILGID